MGSKMEKAIEEEMAKLKLAKDIIKTPPPGLVIDINFVRNLVENTIHLSQGESRIN